jgi:hypothetical protein
MRLFVLEIERIERLMHEDPVALHAVASARQLC